MMKIKNLISANTIFMLLALTMFAATAGAVSQTEANKLGDTLTGVGAEMAGNKEGTIPSYTGVSPKAPARYKPGSGVYADPFSSERPLFSINAGNLNKYADKLTLGTKELFKRYPDSFRIDVYPTHRSSVFPDWLLKNTKKNAITARTADGGLSFENASGGYPFPIPHTGYEALFNNIFVYQGKSFVDKNKSFGRTGPNAVVPGAEGAYYIDMPYYHQEGSNPKWSLRLHWEYSDPPGKSGEKLVLFYSINPYVHSDLGYQYLPGQRRVRVAPELKFDAPNPAGAGLSNMDEIFGWSGSMERYDMKLIGKKEIYIPYNNYKMSFEAKADTIIIPYFPNPDITRWELHRVWIVEGTLRSGKRHQYPKRYFYLDEDSWVIVIGESLDKRNMLSRIQWSFMCPLYDEKRIHVLTGMYMDVPSRNYGINNLMGEGGYNRSAALRPERFWSPDSFAGTGVR